MVHGNVDEGVVLARGGSPRFRGFVQKKNCKKEVVIKISDWFPNRCNIIHGICYETSFQISE